MDLQNKPLIVQGADTVLLEVASPLFEEARTLLLRFAELVKAPEHVHTYRITALSVWNARSSGLDADQMIAALKEYSRYPVPDNVVHEIRTHASRYGTLRIVRDDEGLVLESSDEVGDATPADGGPTPFEQATVGDDVRKWLGTPLRAVDESEPAADEAPKPSARQRFRVDPEKRGLLKLALVKAGFPPSDEAGYVDGDDLEFEWRDLTLEGAAFALRDYQVDAARAFTDARWSAGGSGVVVLPCGAGKTIVGIACMHALQTTTLVLCTSVSAAKQWVAEMLDKTTLTEEQVGLYHGDERQLKPGDRGDLPDADPPPLAGRADDQHGGLRPGQLGPDRLRRGAPAAGADLPGHGRPAGTPSPRPDRDAGARGRARGGRLRPDRSQEGRRALARTREPGLGGHRGLP